MRKLQFLFLLFVLTSLSSCLELNDLSYLQNNDLVYGSLKGYNNKPPSYLIHTNDVLSVKIKSIDGETANYMNLEPEQGINTFDPSATYINGYSVDELGNIFLPGVGRIKVRGLTISMAREVIQREVNKDLSNATAFVTLASFKVTVLGEVNNPGYYYVYNNQLTIFEAIALAGDLQPFADRKSINLVRQGPEGPMGINIDITDANILTSPYYYILPNDMIYVRPLEVQPKRSNLENLGLFQAIFAGASTLATIILIWRN